MKDQGTVSKIIIILATCSLCILFPLTAYTADVENCLLCHKYSGLGRIDDSGKKHLFYVNEEYYIRSTHGILPCKDCHTNVEKFPHVDLERVDCATKCHAIEPSTERKFSHARMIKKFQLSVHGRGTKENLKKYPEDLPTCTYCHENRILEPILCMPGHPQEIACEVLDRCLGCHDDENWTRIQYTHLTHRLKRRRSSVKMVRLCASCHEDEQKMKRHGLEVTGTYRDTMHWKAILYGDPNAPNCIDCHAPVGYFSHEIMPKDNPKSSIYKGNLVLTCSNPSGLQKCHIDATPAFAQGKIHPSGAKAKLFDLKLAAFKKKEKIKKGKLTPFESLLAEKAQEELTPTEYYQALVLRIIKYFYMILIGALISFMIVHQILDFFATRREIKKGGTHK